MRNSFSALVKVSRTLQDSLTEQPETAVSFSAASLGVFTILPISSPILSYFRYVCYDNAFTFNSRFQLSPRWSGLFTSTDWLYHTREMSNFTCNQHSWNTIVSTYSTTFLFIKHKHTLNQGSSTRGPPATLGRVLCGSGTVFHKIQCVMNIEACVTRPRVLKSGTLCHRSLT